MCSVKSAPARYLFRFDDLCPTMLSDRWDRFYSILSRHAVRPILAVVPDNHDPALNLQAADPGFWNRMRSLEAEGATIAMHGYRHRWASRGTSLVGLHDETEFAGVEESQQRIWIRSGLCLLRDQGLSPRLFVAPRHGFDRATLRALALEGLGILSDGFSRRPFTRCDVVWIPQQLWEPVVKTSGLWTICIHSNTAPESLAQKVERFLDENATQVTSFDKVIAETRPRALGWAEQAAEAMAHTRIRAAGKIKRRLLAR
jgi:hypothetical protein